MIDVNFNVLDKLKSIIESDGELTITLNKSDLMLLHDAILNEEIVVNSVLDSVKSNDAKTVEEFCSTVAEIRADSVSDMESIVHSIACKIL